MEKYWAMNPHDKVTHHLPCFFSNIHYDMIFVFMEKKLVLNPLHICDFMQDVDIINNPIVGLATNEPIDFNNGDVKR